MRQFDSSNIEPVQQFPLKWTEQRTAIYINTLARETGDAEAATSWLLNISEKRALPIHT